MGNPNTGESENLAEHKEQWCSDRLEYATATSRSRGKTPTAFVPDTGEVVEKLRVGCPGNISVGADFFLQNRNQIL